MLFLDFDDVICLNNTCGGYDAIHALARVAKEPGLRFDDFQDLWDQLFDANAKRYLKALHHKFSPWYVLTTSWWWLLEKDALEQILRRSGLEFVADNLHAGWATPKGPRPDVRAREISDWLGRNAEFVDGWVVLDDELSGTGLADWAAQSHTPFVVLCKENVGLTEIEFKRLQEAFRLRAKSANQVTMSAAVKMNRLPGKNRSAEN
ncbi:MAG: HAD domain-containing protein [Rhodoferax sp.]|nr:HAD domain-containing protein [Rhodoferax sp.]